jgi:myosin-5
LDEDDEVVTRDLAQFRGMSFVLGPFARRDLTENDDANSGDDDDNDDAQSAMGGHQGFDRSTATILKEGFLKKKKEESSGWQKRFVVLTEYQLLYYRWKRDKRPKKALSLTGAMVKKSTTIDAGFELYHPTLLSRTNKQGCLQFKADNEAELQQWMTPLRAITGVTSGVQQNTRHLDLGFRRDWLRLTNKQGDTPLHFVAHYRNTSTRAQHVPAHRQVMAASWLLEMGSLVNVQDSAGNTPLHLADLQDKNNELTSCLIIKGANAALRNSAGQSPLDFASMEVVERISVGRRGLADRHALLPPPKKLQGYSYLSIYLEKNSMPSTSALENPFLTISVYNARRSLVEPQQDVSLPIMRKQRYLWWGTTWHMQTPLENLDEGGCVVVVEFKDQRFKSTGRYTSSEIDEIAWVSQPVDLKRIESRSVNFEMQLYPVDISKSVFPAPADCFLEGDIALSRKLFDVDVKALARSLEDKDEVIQALGQELVWRPPGEDAVGTLRSSTFRRSMSRSMSKRSPELGLAKRGRGHR